jgi:hypothetical protein
MKHFMEVDNEVGFGTKVVFLKPWLLAVDTSYYY